VRYGTAKTAMIQFEHNIRASSVTLQLNQVRAFNEERGEMIQAAFQPIGPVQLPKFVRKRMRFLSLQELKILLKDPKQFSEIRSTMGSLRQELRKNCAYEMLMRQIQKGRLELQDSKHVYEITAHNVQQTWEDGRIALEGNVKVVQHRVGGHRTFLADRAIITAEDTGSDKPPLITISMKTVHVSDSRTVDPDSSVEHERYILDEIPAMQDAVQMAQQITNEQLLDPDYQLELSDDPMMYDRLRKKRNKAYDLIHGTSAKAAAEIHSRAAYSASAIVLLLLGATLGTIFKGGHFVSAFGLSFVPMLLVVVMNMTGRQISATVDSPFIGPAVIWIGVVIVLAADVVVLCKFLRR